MEFLLNVFNFFRENAELLGASALAIVGAAELVVRLTPTKKDDGFVERVGHYVRIALDFLKVPNLRKEEKHPEAEEKEK